MLRLVADEVRKLKRTWILPLLPFLFFLAPLLGVLTVKANSQRDPERILFDFATVFIQVQLDNTILMAPLTLGILGIYLLQREYQEATLAPLCTVPIKKADLLTAKMVLVGLVGALGAVLSAAVTVPLALVTGAIQPDGAAILEGSLRLIAGEVLTLPSILLLLLAVVLFRNYLVAVAVAFGTIILGMVSINLPQISAMVPWLSPTLLSVDAKTLEGLGLSAADAGKSAATLLLFTGALAPLLAWTFEMKKTSQD